VAETELNVLPVRVPLTPEAALMYKLNAVLGLDDPSVLKLR